MKLVNLTSNAIVLVADCQTLILKPSGTVCYLEEQTYDDGDMDVEGVNVPVKVRMYGRVINEPESEDDTGYIVDENTARQLLHRGDIYLVDQAVYGEDEQLFGYNGLISLG